MKKTVFKKIFLLLLFCLVFILKEGVNAQPVCGPAQVGMIIYVYSDESCTTGVPYAKIHFWTEDPNQNEFDEIANEDGVIYACFPYINQYWYLQGQDLGCGAACINSFIPENLPNGVKTYRLDCEPECYCGDRPGLNINDENGAPTRYFLFQNYPNPFNPATNIKFDLPKDSYVKLRIYDISGKEVTTLVDGIYTAGKHSIDFDGSNLSSGLYVYKLETPQYTQIRKMVLVK